MERECVVIDGVQYSAQSEATGEIRIVILQRGWVAVGRWKKDGEQCRLENASIIRVWGTSKGLGEIAISGPNDKTKLDACPNLHFHELTVIASMECVGDKWEKHCS